MISSKNGLSLMNRVKLKIRGLDLKKWVNLGLNKWARLKVCEEVP